MYFLYLWSELERAQRPGIAVLFRLRRKRRVHVELLVACLPRVSSGVEKPLGYDKFVALMRSFFCPDIPAAGREATLEGEEAQHALRVLRLREGEALRLIDGHGTRARAEITNTAGRNRHSSLTCRILDRQTWAPPRCRLHLLIAPPRAKLMAQIVRDAVELGVWRISPVICEFSVAKPEPGSSLVHWRAEAVAAAKQSGNPFLPAIDPPRPLAAALADAGAPGFYGALPEPGHTAVPMQPNAGVTPENIPVFVGPEGGFSAAERAVLAAAGHRPIALGSWTLRVETAVTAMIGFLLGMGGDDLCCHQCA